MSHGLKPTLRAYIKFVAADLKKHKDLSVLFAMSGAGSVYGIFMIFWSYDDIVKHVPVDGPPHKLYLHDSEKLLRNNPTQERLLKEIGGTGVSETYKKKKMLLPYIF